MIKISENEDRVLSGKGGEPAASGSEHSMHPADLKRYVNDINAEAKKLDAELKACMKDPASAKEQVKELSKKLTFCTKQMKLCVAVMNRVAKYEQGKEFTKKEGMATDFEKIKTAKQNAFDAAKAGGKADVAAGKLFATKEEKK